MQDTGPQSSGSPEKNMPGKNCFAFLKGQRQRCDFLFPFYLISLLINWEKLNCTWLMWKLQFDDWELHLRELETVQQHCVSA